MKVIFNAEVESPRLVPHWAPRILAARPYLLLWRILPVQEERPKDTDIDTRTQMVSKWLV